MRKWILNLHLYGCLICSGYLIIFGYTSLHFNHRSDRPEVPTSKVTWEQAISIPPIQENLAAAEAVRDALGLMGWPLPWKMNRDAEGNLHFDMERPGKSYTLHVLAKEGKVRVEERRKGFWAAVNSLHALRELPNSRFVPAWGVYTEVCTWVVLFASVSGIYLWASSQRERKIGIITVATAVALSLSFILYVILRG